MSFRITPRLVPYLLLVASVGTRAQQPPSPFPSPLDLGQNITPVAHTPLPEEYIWTDGDVTALRVDRSRFPWRNQQARTQPHGFRRSFQITSVPPEATLYLAGPRDAEVFLNGQRLAHFSSNIDAPIAIHVFHADAAKLLRKGDNVIAIQAVRGPGIVAGDPIPATLQLTYGEVLAVKLTAAPAEAEGPVLLRSDRSWRSATLPTPAASAQVPPWAQPGFDDSGWSPAQSLGPIESNRDFMQWSADAGMYAWPGYQGLTPPLGTYEVSPVAVTHRFAGDAVFEHLEALTAPTSQQTFDIVTPPGTPLPTDAEAPSILLDFGREIAGRLLVQSASGKDALLSIAYGESELEAQATGLTPGQRGGNYLGTNLLEVPANGIARGPKSAFRFVRIRFLRSLGHMSFRSIRAEGIAYPVTYLGSFESSDPLLNRIWQTGAYTVHLCMQDDLWDAPKRDRGRWAGDIDVEGRVISTVFGDTALLERTLSALAPSRDHSVNGIPNYSPLWITSLDSLYAHSGDLAFLRSQHQALLHVLSSMDAELEPTGDFINRKHEWLFVDWAPALYGNTPAATLGTRFQLLRGYRTAAGLLDTLADHSAADHARSTAAVIEKRLAADLPHRGIGRSWQITALAVQQGFFDASAPSRAVWSDVLSHVKQDSPEDQVVSPYFNATVLDAMSHLGHPRQALDWIRTYWGGMLDEGATSFWESYDLRWPKDTPHLSLQADGTSGFFVSLAHGWSAGPTAWLSENVLGIRDPADGYRTVTIAPRLLGLHWAKGAVPTPNGKIRVDIRLENEAEHIVIDLPPGVQQANISLQPPRAGTTVLLDGQPASSSGRLTLTTPGSHTIIFTPETLQ